MQTELLRTPGYLLRKYDWREADQRTTLLTRQLGKIEAIARGSKKIQSKLAGHLQFFCCLDLSLARGRTFDQLIGVSIETRPANFSTDIHKIILAEVALEFIDRLTTTGQTEPELFSLIQRYFLNLDQSAEITPAIARQLQRQFAVRALTAVGYQPLPAQQGDEKAIQRLVRDRLDSPLRTARALKFFGLDGLFVF